MALVGEEDEAGGRAVALERCKKALALQRERPCAAPEVFLKFKFGRSNSPKKNGGFSQISHKIPLRSDLQRYLESQPRGVQRAQQRISPKTLQVTFR